MSTKKRMSVTPTLPQVEDAPIPGQIMSKEQQLAEKAPVVAEFPMLADTDSRYVSIGVPSNFMFYEYDTMSIRPFTLEELKKISKSYIDQNLSHLVEAVNACIDRSVYDMTIGDFWSLLYWERINSYKRYPYVVKGTCTDPAHLKDVKMKQLEAKTLELSDVLTSANLTVRDIPEARSLEIESFVEKFADSTSVFLYPTTVSDLLELAENPELASSISIKYATHLNRAYGKTLAERDAYLASSPLSKDLDSLTDIEDFIALCDHGVNEVFSVKCTGCGKSTDIELSIDALSFFPGIQRN